MRFAMWCDLRSWAGFRGSWGRSRRGPVALRRSGAGGLGSFRACLLAWAISGRASGDPGRQVVTVTAAAIRSGVELVTISGRGGDGQSVHASGVCPSGVGAGPLAILASWAGGRSSRLPGPLCVRGGLAWGLGRSGRGVSSCQAVPGPGAASMLAGGRRQAGRGPLRGAEPNLPGRGILYSPADFSGAILPGAFFRGPLPADQIFRAAILLFFQNFSGGDILPDAFSVPNLIIFPRFLFIFCENDKNNV